MASEKSTSLAILSSRFLKSFKFVSLISSREKKFYCCLSFASFWAVTLKGTNTYRTHEDFPNLHIKPQTISLHLQWLGWYNLNVSFFYWSTFIVFNIIKKHYVSRKKLLGWLLHHTQLYMHLLSICSLSNTDACIAACDEGVNPEAFLFAWDDFSWC